MSLCITDECSSFASDTSVWCSECSSHLVDLHMKVQDIFLTCANPESTVDLLCLSKVAGTILNGYLESVPAWKQDDTIKPFIESELEGHTLSEKIYMLSQVLLKTGVATVNFGTDIRPKPVSI